MLLGQFLRASSFNLLPRQTLEQLPLQVKTSRGLTLPTPLGFADGVSVTGEGLDGLLDCFGVMPD